ncbi:S9 family peptidase, partial [bacterium]|nr:S9 family peptidase [bacterium]
QLDIGSVTKVGRVQSYQLPEKGSGWLAYQRGKDPALAKQEADKDKKKKDDTDSDLVIRRLADGREWTFHAVTEYQVAKTGQRILFACSAADSAQKPGVYVFNTSSASWRMIQGGKAVYKKLLWDEQGQQAAFLADSDTSKNQQRFYALFCWRTENDSAQLLLDTLKTGFPQHWLISENQTLQFSRNGENLFLGTAPIPLPEDTTLVEFETAKLDIWHYQDPLLQSQQVHDLEKELKRSYTAVVRVKNGKFSQLAGVDLPELKIVQEGDAGWALGLSGLPYQLLLSWEGNAFQDLYCVRTADGARTLIAPKIAGPVSASPHGKYALWFDEVQGHWFSYEVASGKTNNLTAGLGVSFADELNDRPDYAAAYGLMGWTAQDRRVLLYDRFDIWELDPANKAAARIITKGLGRQEQTSYRYLSLDPEAKFIDGDKPLLLKTFDYRDKSEGFCSKRLSDDVAPLVLFHAAQSLGKPIKAKQAERLVFTRSTFRDFPDLWTADTRFTQPLRRSDANPQQADYLWGSVELVRWLSNDGKPLQGLLYKPENFDSTRQYPMIVYFYERNADLLHRYFEPRPSASSVSPVFYASRGYLFFIPDIIYEAGYPGKSALSCILPGVQAMISRGFVDQSRIGIQGQSWGGYQVAYLVTHSHLFRCAGAGAPVSNMTSAYGGIRLESGRVRQFQYEREQSRIGATLWEKPWHYIENSPLFKVPDVTTPLLIMHNDNDGAVPYQQGIELFTALRRLGKPAWLLVYNG